VRRLSLAALVLGLIAACSAATFGTIVPIRGHISDIALDEGRGVVYAANFTANRIEVISMASLSLQKPIQLQPSPLDFSPLAFSTLALSPDGRYLVVGHHANVAPPLTIIDLAGNTIKTVDLNGASVLAVAFGSSPQALVVTNSSVQLLDPASGLLQQLKVNRLRFHAPACALGDLRAGDYQGFCRCIRRWPGDLCLSGRRQHTCDRAI